MAKYWESEKVFLDGDLYFDHLLSDIERARELITVEIYIFNYDHIGKKVASHLIDAHKRGVKVQIIVDGIGTYGYFDQLDKVFSAAGLKVKIFHPLPFFHPYYGNLIFSKKIRAFFTRIGKLNQRNHRKIITIDHNIMYLGSFNFTEEHTSFHTSIKWKDMGVKVTGPNVKLPILYFKKIWQLREFFRYRKLVKAPRMKEAKNAPLRLNHSLMMRRFYYKNLHQRIYTAKDKIWLMTPYFIPTRRLIIALSKAAKRGVDVRILISSKTDIGIFQKLQFFYYAFLINKGVKIFQYVETVLHAKITIIDDWVTVGTSNLNHRSILHDLEVDLSIEDAENKKIIMNDFLMSSPPEQQFTAERLKKRTLLDRLLSRIFFLFKYWF